MILKRVIFVCLFFIANLSFGQIAAWQLNGATGSEVSRNATILDPNLNTSTLSRIGGVNASALANAFGGTNFTASGTRADALTNWKGYTFAISTLTGYNVSLSTLDVRFRRSGTGPNNFAWYYSLDGTSFTQIGSDFTYTLTTTGGDAQAQINLSGITALQNVTFGTTITFRLIAWGASATTGTFAIGRSLTTGATDYSLAIGGTVTPSCTPPSNPTGTITGTTPACSSTTLTYSGTATAPIINYWQSTPTGTSTANNAASPLAVTTSGNYYVRAYNPTSGSGCWSTTAVGPYAVVINPAPTITVQPSNQSIAAAQSTTFSVTASNATAYQWQVSIDNGATWTNLTNTVPYTTVTTATMNIANATFAMNGYQYRCVVSGTAPCAAINSNVATLSVVNAINTLADLGTQVTAAFVPQATVNHVLFKFQISPTVTTNLQGIANVVTAGTYVSTDIVNLKVRYSVDNILDAADVTLSTLTTPGVAGAKTFPAFTAQSITGGATGYIFITADISGTAVIGNTISINAVTTANLIFSLGTKTGSTTAGGTQTIAPSAPLVPASFTKGCTTNTTQVLNWTAPAGTFDGYIVVARQGGLNPHVITSLVASSQTFNTDFSLAPTYGSTAPLSRVVYIGTGTTATITGLTTGATYVFEIYTYRNNGPTNSVYSTTSRTTTQVIGLNNVTSATSTAGNTTGLIGWANPNAICFDQVLVVVTSAAGITFTPTGDGSAYTANPAFSAFNQVVYASSGNNVNITGLTNGDTYYVEIFVRFGTQWSTGVEVTCTPQNIVPTVFKTGDLMLIAYDNTVGGADDAIRLFNLVSINPGTSFIWANATYETGGMPAANVRTDKWYSCTATPDGNLPYLEFTYTGLVPIPAASVMCINTVSAGTGSTITVVDPSGTTYNNFTITGKNADGTILTSHGSVNVSSSAPDSMFLLQGYFTYNITGSTFTGTVLSGVQDGGLWYNLTDDLTAISGNNFRRSRKHPQLLCASMQANTTTGAYEVSYNTSSSTYTNGNRPYLIASILGYTTNWINTLGTCPTASPFVLGTSDPFNKWTGGTSNNWFDCNNWSLLTVPDELTDVVIDNTGANDAVVDYTAYNSDTYSDLAKCKDLTVSGRKIQVQGNLLNKLQVYGNLSISNSGVLDMDDSNTSTDDGQLYVYGNWTNSVSNTAFEEGNGTVHFVGSATQVINSNVHSNVEQFYNVVLDNDFNTTVSNNLYAKGNLELKINKILTIGTGDHVFAYKKLTNNGDIIINNSGQLVQVDDTDTNDGDYSGAKFRLTRTAQAKHFDYIYWSAPTENYTVTNLPTDYHYFWNPTYSNTNGTQGNWISASGSMIKGKGYIARASNNSTTAVALTATFTGKPNNGQLTLPISRGNYDGADYDADLTNATNALTTKYDDNWNLVGNPYPSAIDAEEFLVLNQSVIEGSIWVWKHGLNPTSSTSPFYNNYQYNYNPTSDYIKYNGLGSTEPDTFAGKIASGQGFMVNMLHAAPTPNTLAFTNNLRADASIMSYDNTDFFRANWMQNQKHRIWLDIVNTSTGSKDRTLVGYATNATNGRDQLYDCISKITGNLSVYSMIQDEPFAIQGKGLPFNSNDRIPLGVNVNANGTYQLAIYKTDGLFAGQQDIYIEDKLTGHFHDLKASPFSVTLNQGVYNNRFVLRFNNPGASLGNTDFNSSQSVITSVKNQIITAQSADEPIAEMQVLDLLGRTICVVEGNASTNIASPSLTVSHQTVVVKIRLDSGVVVTRKVIL
ncbi:MAG: hypothetical protein RL607_1285 [Bacteroidota bacterium]